MSEREEYSVWVFFPDGTHHAVLRWVDAKTAVEKAKSQTETIGARIGTTVRIIITDGGDLTCFEWKYGEGVTYPKPGEPPDPDC